ncbi:MAG: hypothetical protein NTY09_01590 [bacterium]|nr:hypothetical protein [bacterium]
MKKDFDCVEMKRKAQEKIYEDIKDLTLEEEIEYFRKGAEQFQLELDQLRKQKKTDKQPKSGKKASGKAV